MKSIIIEGIDRLGKDTLIKGIQDKLGFFQEIHYQKPKHLEVYHEDAVRWLSTQHSWHDGDARTQALKRYQEDSFEAMFMMLNSDIRFIMNRAHLGEAVYSKRYRHYDGDYVFKLEKEAQVKLGSGFLHDTLLVLLTTSDFSFIKDDGLSFDFNKKEEEQEDFKAAFEKSNFRNKLMIDVAARNGDPFYRSQKDILNEVLEAYK